MSYYTIIKHILFVWFGVLQFGVATGQSTEFCFKSEIQVTDTITEILENLCIIDSKKFIEFLNEYSLLSQYTIEYVCNQYGIPVNTPINGIDNGASLNEIIKNRFKTKYKMDLYETSSEDVLSMYDLLNRIYTESLNFNLKYDGLSEGLSVYENLLALNLGLNKSFLNFIHEFIVPINYTVKQIVQLLDLPLDVSLNRLFDVDESFNSYINSKFTVKGGLGMTTTGSTMATSIDDYSYESSITATSLYTTTTTASTTVEQSSVATTSKTSQELTTVDTTQAATVTTETSTRLTTPTEISTEETSIEMESSTSLESTAESEFTTVSVSPTSIEF